MQALSTEGPVQGSNRSCGRLGTEGEGLGSPHGSIDEARSSFARRNAKLVPIRLICVHWSAAGPACAGVVIGGSFPT